MRAFSLVIARIMRDAPRLATGVYPSEDTRLSQKKKKRRSGASNADGLHGARRYRVNTKKSSGKEMIRSLFLPFSLARSRVPLRKRRDGGGGGGERHSVHSSLRHRSPRNRENMAADARRVSRTAARKSTVSPFTSVSHTASNLRSIPLSSTAV